MGYDAYGSVTVTFADADQLAGYLNTERPTAPPRTGSDVKELAKEFTSFMRDFFEYADQLTPEDASDATVRFAISVDGRWSRADDFTSTSIAEWASQVDGSFIGEDDAGWGWELIDGVIHETERPRLEESEYRELAFAKSRLDRLTPHLDNLTAAAVAANRDTAELAAHGALLVLADNPTPELLALLADYPDPRVRDAVTAIITAAAS